MPSQGVATRSQSRRAKQRVICLSEPVVMGARDHIQSLAEPVDVGTRLESAHPKGLEYLFGLSGGSRRLENVAHPRSVASRGPTLYCNRGAAIRVCTPGE